MGGSSAGAPSEFSRIVGLERLAKGTTDDWIEATAAERGLVKQRLDLLSLDQLSARCRISPGLAGLIRVDCEWRADLSQACVVTLAPVEQALAGRFHALYQSHGGDPAAKDEVVVDPEADDPPESLPAGGIDLGELVVQELAVALDPYPRAKGAEIPSRYRPEETEEASGAFDALRVLKSKD